MYVLLYYFKLFVSLLFVSHFEIRERDERKKLSKNIRR